MGAADAVLTAVLAYAGLRPSEAAALQWRDVQERTLLVERAAELDTGGVKGTKTDAARAVRLLAPLAHDLTEWRLRCGRPGLTTHVFPPSAGRPWRKHDWDNWQRRVWTAALASSGLEYAVPYSCRHTFASLLLAEGRTVYYVAGQLWHGAEQTLRTYGTPSPSTRTARTSTPIEIRLARG